MLKDHRKQAEEHMSLGERHLAHQRELTETRAMGTTPRQPSIFFASFERSWAAHIADRARITKELSKFESV